MDNIVLNPLSPEEQERLKSFQEGLEGQELTVLIERVQKQFDLSVNQIAVAAGMDESALHKILKGENREFKAEYVDRLLDDLQRQSKLNNVYEITIWKRALRIAAYLHFDLYKTVEPRLRQIEDPVKRVEALKEYLSKQYPALAETYDDTGGIFPAFLPLLDVVAREWNKNWEMKKHLVAINTVPSKTGNSTNKDVLVLGGIEFILIPAGKFIMGSESDSDFEKPQRTVDIPYDYWMARYPVTNDLI